MVYPWSFRGDIDKTRFFPNSKIIAKMPFSWPPNTSTLSHCALLTICRTQRRYRQPGPVNDRCQDDQEDRTLYDKRWQQIWTLGIGADVTYVTTFIIMS